MSNQVSLGDYWHQLNRHDWFYDYSDDHSVWVKGSAERAQLLGIAKQSPEHQALYDDFKKYRFSGKSFGSEPAPKPEKPGDEA